MYCSEQIHIPADLPEILKNYTKHVIKNQPKDIIAASAEYFGRLAKQRVKSPTSTRKLTAQHLEAVYRKLTVDHDVSFTRKQIEAIATDVPASQLAEILTLGMFDERAIPPMKFFGLLVASAAGTLHATMETLCEILGDNSLVSVNPLVEIFAYLAERDPNVSNSTAQEWIKNAKDKGDLIDISWIKITLQTDIPEKFESPSVISLAPPTQVIEQPAEVADGPIAEEESSKDFASQEPRSTDDELNEAEAVVEEKVTVVEESNEQQEPPVEDIKQSEVVLVESHEPKVVVE